MGAFPAASLSCFQTRRPVKPSSIHGVPDIAQTGLEYTIYALALALSMCVR